MSAALDRNALKIDVAASKGAWDEMATLMRSVNGYVSAVESLDANPVDVFQTKVDLFYNLPELREVLVNARGHVAGWTDIGMRLSGNIVMQIFLFGHTLTSVAREIKGIVKTASDAGRALAPAERTRIVDLLRHLQSSLARSAADIDGQKPGIEAFLALITTDSTPLQQGAADLGKAIPKVQSNTADLASKYVLDPLSAGIYKAIVELGGKILQRLQALRNTLEPLARSHDNVLHSLQGILTLWTTIKEKYSAVIDVLVLTETSLETLSILPDLMDIAAESWQQLSDYVIAPPAPSSGRFLMIGT